jgi:hypothetical protein
MLVLAVALALALALTLALALVLILAPASASTMANEEMWGAHEEHLLRERGRDRNPSL